MSERTISLQSFLNQRSREWCFNLLNKYCCNQLPIVQVKFFILQRKKSTWYASWIWRRIMFEYSWDERKNQRSLQFWTHSEVCWGQRRWAEDTQANNGDTIWRLSIVGTLPKRSTTKSWFQPNKTSVESISSNSHHSIIIFAILVTICSNVCYPLLVSSRRESYIPRNSIGTTTTTTRTIYSLSRRISVTESDVLLHNASWRLSVCSDNENVHDFLSN